MSDLTQDRKDDHIRISLKEQVQARHIRTGFEEVHFVHRALPEINRSQIHLATKFFGHSFSAPLLVGAMTGGTQKATKINSSIALAIEELGLGMGVGSQRAALENSTLESTYRIIRKKAPTAFLVANVGAPQLVQGYGVKEALNASKMIEANALAIHLNPLQETIQPEGEVNFNGVLQKIAELSDSLEIPVIVKETGAGISREVAKNLEAAGVKGIDVSGAGGTSWAAVEYYRAKTSNDVFRQHLGKNFWDWGLPTAISLVEVVQSTKLAVIASGGLRNGIHVAKSLALGASLTSMSTPILGPATKSASEVKKTLYYYIEELRNTMFLVGAKSILELKKTPLILLGKTSEWLEKRGFKTRMYARR